MRRGRIYRDYRERWDFRIPERVLGILVCFAAIVVVFRLVFSLFIWLIDL
jgi:hypothetical protein